MVTGGPSSLLLVRYSEQLATHFGEVNAEMLGIVSATVEVSSMEVLTSVESDPAVYLVDLAAEDVRRSNPRFADVVMNDLYWQLAGWSE